MLGGRLCTLVQEPPEQWLTCFIETNVYEFLLTKQFLEHVFWQMALYTCVSCHDSQQQYMLLMFDFMLCPFSFGLQWQLKRNLCELIPGPDQVQSAADGYEAK